MKFLEVQPTINAHAAHSIRGAFRRRFCDLRRWKTNYHVMKISINMTPIFMSHSPSNIRSFTTRTWILRLWWNHRRKANHRGLRTFQNLDTFCPGVFSPCCFSQRSGTPWRYDSGTTAKSGTTAVLSLKGKKLPEKKKKFSNKKIKKR